MFITVHIYLAFLAKIGGYHLLHYQIMPTELSLSKLQSSSYNEKIKKSVKYSNPLEKTDEKAKIKLNIRRNRQSL